MKHPSFELQYMQYILHRLLVSHSHGWQRYTFSGNTVYNCTIRVGKWFPVKIEKNKLQLFNFLAPPKYRNNILLNIYSELLCFPSSSMFHIIVFKSFVILVSISLLIVFSFIVPYNFFEKDKQIIVWIYSCFTASSPLNLDVLESVFSCVQRCELKTSSL